jgi:GxxExxY protein
VLHKNITEEIIAAAMRIHTAVGPGLLESAYRDFLYFDLVRKGWEVAREKKMPAIYDGFQTERGFRIDLLVDNKVVVELKTVDLLRLIHRQQLLTYLKLGNFRAGLLINFRVPHLRDGLKRVSN